MVQIRPVGALTTTERHINQRHREGTNDHIRVEGTITREKDQIKDNMNSTTKDNIIRDQTPEGVIDDEEQRKRRRSMEEQQEQHVGITGESKKLVSRSGA